MRRVRISTSLALAAIVASAACGSSANKPTGPATGTETPVYDGEQPKKADGRAFPDEPFREEQPGAGEPRSFQLPSINHFVVADAVDVYLVESHELPTVSLSVELDGGELTDPKGKRGRASVCMSMLTEGTKKLDKLAFEEALSDVASHISSYASDETHGVTMRSLSKHFDYTFELFVDSLAKPGLRKPEMDRLLARRLESLKQAKGSASSVAGRLFSNIAYGASHPLGRLVTEDSLGRLSRRDCRRFVGRHVKPRGARMYIVGDMTEDDARAAAKTMLESWRGKPREVAGAPEASPRDGRVFFVDVPGSAQSAVYLTHPGPARSADDYFANTLMAKVLGGSFSSRINMNLREDKGYAYGAFGGFTYNRTGGLFFAGSSVRSDSTYQTVLELLGEMRAMSSGKEPATESELAREKKGAILGLPGEFATSKDTLRMYRRLIHFDLPLDFYNSYVGNVQEVTIPQVMKSAEQHLAPGKAKVLVVGDGDAELIVREDGKDVSLEGEDGEPLTLREGLEKLVASDKVSGDKLVVLDADGKVQKTATP